MLIESGYCKRIKCVYLKGKRCNHDRRPLICEEDNTLKCLSAKKLSISAKTIGQIKRWMKNLKSDIIHQTKIRKRGTIILKTQRGILVVQEPNGSWSLPGGGIEKNESDVEGALRELREETTVKGKRANYQFDTRGNVHRNRQGQRYVNLYKIYEVTEYENQPKPSNEIRKIRYWKPEKDMRLTSTTERILDIYSKPWKTPQFRQYCRSMNCVYEYKNGCGRDNLELYPPDKPKAYFENGIPCCDDMRCPNRD